MKFDLYHVVFSRGYTENYYVPEGTSKAKIVKAARRREGNKPKKVVKISEKEAAKSKAARVELMKEYDAISKKLRSTPDHADAACFLRV